MFTFKPLGNRVLIELVGQRKFPFPIKLPDKTEVDGMNRWVIRDMGEGPTTILSGVVVPITGLTVGDEVVFDQKRAAEIVPPIMNGGKIMAFLDVEAIHGTISGESEAPPTPIAIAKNMPSLQRAA